MDYGTFFFANVASVIVFTVCMALVALYNRRVSGMAWFAAATFVGLIKLVLQGLEGRVPPVFANMLANELYLVSFMMQFMGLRWFVVREPMRRRWPWIAVCLFLAAYTVMFFLRTPSKINSPVLAFRLEWLD
jgi:hypothetical protein